MAWRRLWVLAALLGCADATDRAGDAATAGADAQAPDGAPGRDAEPDADAAAADADAAADAAALDAAAADAAAPDGATALDAGAADAASDAGPPRPAPPPRRLVALFDALDAALNGGRGLSDGDNESAGLAWGESYVQQGYLAMYAATGEPRYLIKLAEHADAVLLQRDDVRGVGARPCWRNLHYQDRREPYCYAVHTGQILLPLVDFARVVATDAALAALPGPDGETLGAKAERYVAAARASVAAHDHEWRAGPRADEGHYVFPADAPAGVPRGNQPANQQNVLGSVYFGLHALTGEAAYLDRATRLARLFARALATRGDAYVWDYWDRLPDDRDYDGPGEDISHAAINVQFAARARRAGAVFGDEAMARFVATFTDLVAAGEAAVHDRVDGTGASGDYDLQAARWLELAPWDRAGALYFTIQGRFDEALGWERANGSTLLGVALLAQHESPLALRGLTLVPGRSSDWGGLAVARFGGPDAPPTLVAARRFDGQVFQYAMAADGTLGGGGGGLGADEGAAWSGMAAVDLDGDGRDEVVAARNDDATLRTLVRGDDGRLVLAATERLAGSRFAGLAAGRFAGGLALVVARNAPDGAILVRAGGRTLAERAFGADAAWAGVCAADLDGDDLAEIVAVRNRDAHVLVLRPNGASLDVVAEIDSYGPASRWAAVACPDLDGDGRHEAVGVRDHDGAANVWTLDGAALRGARHVLFGATHAWGPLTAADGLLFGASNRTGHLLVWGR